MAFEKLYKPVFEKLSITKNEGATFKKPINFFFEKFDPTSGHNNLYYITGIFGAVKLSSLLPTVDALDEQTKGCYYQIRQWLGNQNIRATDLGWYLKEGSLHHVRMNKPPALNEVLKMIFSNAKKRPAFYAGAENLGCLVIPLVLGARVNAVIIVHQ